MDFNYIEWGQNGHSVKVYNVKKSDPLILPMLKNRLEIKENNKR